MNLLFDREYNVPPMEATLNWGGNLCYEQFMKTTIYDFRVQVSNGVVSQPIGTNIEDQIGQYT